MLLTHGGTKDIVTCMKHTLLDVSGFFRYLWKEENDTAMETSLGFTHFPIESSLLEESNLVKVNYSNSTHQSNLQKKTFNKNLCQISWKQKNHPYFRASPIQPTKVPPKKATKNRVPAPGFCAYVPRFRKGPSHPPVGKWRFW